MDMSLFFHCMIWDREEESGDASSVFTEYTLYGKQGREAIGDLERASKRWGFLDMEGST
jgi:hypothetical protein